MMRGSGGAIAMAVAALLVCYCSADSHQEQDGNVGDHGSAEQYIASGHKSGNQEALGGNLVREVRETRHFGGLVPYLVRRYDYQGLGGKRDMWPGPVASQSEYSGFYGDGLPKRNFDEIDRSGLDRFVRKRNFDEIDQTSMPFPYATKRFYHLYGPNYLDMPVSSFDKKRLFRPDYPMDEIDLSHFPIGSKRSLDSFPLVPRAQL